MPYAPPNSNSKQGYAAAKVLSKPWPTVTKDADLERILERLDRIARDVELVCDHIAEKLGLDLGTEYTRKEYMSYTQCKKLRVSVYKLYYLIKLHF